VKDFINNEFIVRHFRNGDFDQISILWDLTEMGNQLRGDDNKTIEDSIRIGGAMLILEEIKTEKFVAHLDDF